MLRRFVLLFKRRRLEADLEAEFRDHLEQQVQNNVRAGMTPEEARHAAQRLTGSVELYKEECRDATGLGFFEILIRDLRYAMRMLRRTPLFTLVAMLTLAIGIGANTAVFTFVENVLMRSLPVHNPEQLDSLNWGTGTNFSYLNYKDFRDRNQVFSDLIADRYMPANISSGSTGNFRLWGYEATGNYFQALGVKPALGRLFGPREDVQPGANPVVVLSYRCWRGHFGGDPAIVGKTVKLNGFPFTIIGVAASSFTGTELILDGEYWVPMSMELEIEPDNAWVKWRTSQNAWVQGRRRPGVTRAQAEANLNELAAQLAREYPNDVSSSVKIHLAKPGLIGNALRGPITGFGVVLMGIAALGLLLACINLAGMLLARASDRRREVGIRLAIGASRWQLLRQLMTESLLLSVCGGLFGIGLSYTACHFLSSWRPSFDIPLNIALEPNGTVLGFALIVTILTSVLFGLTPALQTISVDLVPSLKNEPMAARFRKWSARDILVAGQISLSVVLVICSVLVVRSLQHALTLQLGFNPNDAVSVSFDLGLKGYDVARIRQFQANLLTQAANLPGIESAGLTNTMPLWAEGQSSESYWRAGQPLPKPAERQFAIDYNTSAGYFKAAGTQLLSGREFDQRDRDGLQPVIIVNKTLGHKLFGDEQPAGRYMHVSAVDGAIQIVGVVEDGKYESLGEDSQAALFLPMSQHPSKWTTVLVRTSLPASSVVAMLRKLVKDSDPDITIFNAGSVKEQLAVPLFGARMTAIVLGLFGVFAMALAAIGLFALMSYAVSRRTREIGIRMALGARHGQVLSSLLSRTMVLCAVGISIGFIITLAAGGLLSAVLYGVSPRDPFTYFAVLCVMVLVSLTACWMPASRAIRIDPMRALRED